MCYQVEVLEYNEDKAIVTVGESKFYCLSRYRCERRRRIH